MARIRTGLLLCTLIILFQLSVARSVDGVPRWKRPGDGPNEFHSTPFDRPKDSTDTKNGNSPFVQFYIDLGFIVIILVLLYLLWKMLAALYPQLKLCCSKSNSNRSISMIELIEPPEEELEGDICSPPDGSEIILGFNNPLYESSQQGPHEHGILPIDRPPDYETAVVRDKNISAPSVARNNPESPPPKYVKNSPLFE